MGWFSDQVNNAAGAFFGSDYLRDFTHASKTFRTNGYQYAPKFKFLFHVYFDINPQAYSRNVGTGDNFGLAVKSIKLPSFNFETHTMNQYNRKRIVQTKIKYDPIDIAFHDDNGNIIRNLWKAYYTYYYKDGTKPNVNFKGARGGTTTPNNNSIADYNEKTTYKNSIAGDDDWGYIGETSTPTGPNSSKVPFFKNITVFGFNQHNFVAYTLINPIVTRFGHDTYAYADGAGTMEHQMSLDYETVVYNEGALDGRNPSNIVTGFGLDANYDRTLSPISVPGSNSKILGKGGLVDGVGGTMEALANGDLLGALKIGGTTYNTFKNANLKSIARAEATSAIIGAINQTPNRNINIVTPIFGSTPSSSGTAGVNNAGATAPANVTDTKYAGKATGN